MARSKIQLRLRRKVSIRKKVRGTEEFPRLSVFRSSRHIYAQIVNDDANRVVASASTLGKSNQEIMSGLSKIDQAKKVGSTVARICLANGIKKVAFDRNGFKYHGRIKALADSARKSGLNF